MGNRPDPRRVFVAATMQDQGKTTVSLGLMKAFSEHCPPVGFIKPVGQRYVEINGVRVDEDVALMRAIFPDEVELADMSPVTVGRSFTRDYIVSPKPDIIASQIRESFDRMSTGKHCVVIEGTGHAGVGSCFDASNADVARLLQAKVILVAGGGIGKPIDEVLLNHSLFRDSKVDLLGVILNKVLPSKLDQIREVVEKGLARKGIELLGCIPHEPSLANPSMHQVVDELGGEVINGEESLANSIGNVIVGAMAAHRALEYISPNCLLITPGDRADIILAALGCSVLENERRGCVVGMLLTGGIKPDKTIQSLIERTRIPVVVHQNDSYSVAAAVHALKVKIQPSDLQKIHTAPELVRNYVRLDRIMERL